jgi:hypothetical protein
MAISHKNTMDGLSGCSSINDEGDVLYFETSAWVRDALLPPTE